MSGVVRIEVPGVPAPKGSMRSFVVRTKVGKHRAVTTHDSGKTRPWASAVTYAATEAMRGQEPFRSAPLWLSVRFVLPRPTGHYGKRGLRPSAPGWPAVKPDLDKLMRVVGDSLEGVVYDNDSRIVSLHLTKCYATENRAPGVVVEIGVME